MRSVFLILVSTLLAGCLYAQQPKSVLTGKLIQMDSVPCATNSDKDIQNSAVETPAAAQPEALCPQYVLEAWQVVYRIISRNANHPAPLPIGESAQFRLQDGTMLLRVPAFDNVEREYIIVSTSETNAADARPIRLNHLQ
jgi:hypothetical protein